MEFQRPRTDRITPQFPSREVGVVVRIRWRAAAEKSQWLGGDNGVPRAGRDENRIARADGTLFAVEFYFAHAFEDEIKLLCDLMIMPLCFAACEDARFRQALVLDRRVRAIED